MLHAVHLVELLGKLKAATGKNGARWDDFQALIHDAVWEDGDAGDHEEITRTLLEMLEPERIGGIKPFNAIFLESAYKLCWCCGAEIHPENSAKVDRRTCCVKCIESHGLRRDEA
jgi:hypothetical protein